MTVYLNVLKRILTKKSNLLFMMILPTVISAFIIYFSLMESKYTVGIIDYDQTSFTEDFESYLGKTCKLVSVTEDEIEDMILNNGVQCIFVIPKGYTDSFMKETPDKLKTYYQEGSNYSNPILKNVKDYLSGAALIASSSEGRESFDWGMDQFQKENLQIEYLYADSAYNSKTSAAITAFGYMAFCMLFLMTFSTSLIMEDKTTGVTKRLWTSPVKKGSYYIQHLLAYVLIAVVQTVVVILVLPLLGQVSFGHTSLEIFRVIVICVLFSLVCISMGVAINTHAKSKLDAGSISSLINLPILMLGGCLWPIENMPDVLQKIGGILPTTWFIKGASIVVYGGTLYDALQYITYMLMFTVVVIVTSFIVKTRRDEYKILSKKEGDSIKKNNASIVNTKEKGNNKTRRNENGKETLIKVKDLVKEFKTGGEVTRVLNGVNLDIYKNDFTVIMGPSGSGKSTLMYCISGMDSITDGEVIYNDECISKFNEKQIAMLRRGDFGFVFQQMHLVSNLSLFENIAVPGYLKVGRTNAEVNRRAEELLEKVGLKERMKHLPSQVSGGEQQRAAIARALIHSPNLIFADEPTGALNRKNTEEILKLFTQINNDRQSILMVTHDVHVATRATRVIYIEDGAVVGELNLPPYSEEKEKERETQINEWLMSLSW